MSLKLSPPHAVMVSVLALTTIFVRAADELLPAPPDTTLSPVTNADGQVDMFAWKMFIAMNWPAIVPTNANGNTRGIPDTTKSFGTEALTVWETFKEKREVFNRGSVTNGVFVPADPGAWYSEVDYGPLRAADGEQLNSSKPHPPGARVFHTTTKQIFDALDETIEVKSEARELDSPHKGSVVAPRVWRFNRATNVRRPVLYEVKVNYDFYTYLRKSELWRDSTTDKLAKTNSIHLPWRTSGQPKPGGSAQTILTVGYNAAKTAELYGTFSANQSPPTDPPLIGSVHVKAAWIALTEEEIASKTYHTAEAYSYKSNEAGEPVAVLSTFGLIGLHIIQRVHFSDSSGNVDGSGGTFVFATWEHKSVEESIGTDNAYEYSNFYDPNMNGLSGKASFGKIYPVTRRPQAILAQTVSVNNAVHNMLPADSVWQNYKLIGTQFKAVNTTADVAFDAPPGKEETTLGQNSYLANLVLETNHGLQNFRGLPPLIVKADIVPPYNSTLTGNSSSGPVFDRNAANTAFERTGFNMGGCMGCHGVAQIQGFNFSFVLLGGNEGAKTDTETRFDLPLAGPK